MQSRVFWIGSLMLLASAPGVAQDTTAREPLFRYVALVRDTVFLGQPIGRAARFALDPRDSVVVVPIGQFGGADAIHIFRDVTDTVTAVHVYYGARHNIDALQAGFAAEFGDPILVEQDSVAGVARRTWSWADALTEFTILGFSPLLDGMVGAAILRDRLRDP